MAGQKPQFRVMVAREGKDKSFWTQIGVGWSVASEGISLQLDALPVDGKAVIFPIKDKE